MWLKFRNINTRSSVFENCDIQHILCPTTLNLLWDQLIFYLRFCSWIYYNGASISDIKRDWSSFATLLVLIVPLFLILEDFLLTILLNFPNFKFYSLIKTKTQLAWNESNIHRPHSSKFKYLVQILLRLWRTTGFWHSPHQARVVNLVDLFLTVFDRFFYLINIGNAKWRISASCKYTNQWIGRIFYNLKNR